MARLAPIIIMGFNAIVFQVICLRQLLTLFSGNELDIGITLSVWLASVGIGSYAGWRFRREGAYGISFLTLALLIQPTVFLINSLRMFFPLEIGEGISLSLTIVATLVTLLPLCSIIGVQFPLAVSYLRGKTAEVYSFEAIGAFSGGVIFTFLFSGRLDTDQLSLFMGIGNILVALVLLRRRSLLALVLLPVAFYTGGKYISPELGYGGLKLHKKVESRYGEITVLHGHGQFNVYTSGNFHFSYPDPQAEEVRTHLPMAVHHSGRKILLLGGSPAAIRELLKYPVSRVDFVEMDPGLIEVSVSILIPEDRAYLSDKRVRIVPMDARRYVKSLIPSDYDLVILNIPEPSTAQVNRFYTVEFFREAEAVLKKNGILVVSLPTASGYIGRKMQLANGSVFRSLREVFPHVAVSSEDYGTIIASGEMIDIRPEILTERFVKQGIDTKYFQASLLEDAFSPLKVSMVRQRLGKVESINRDLNPVAYLYNLMLWSEIHGGKWLNAVLGLSSVHIAFLLFILLVLSTLFFMKKGGPVYYAIFTTGYFTLAFSVVVILVFQASFGYIYEMIGLLTGTFMLGGAAGAHLMRKVERPIRWLRLFDFFGILLLIFTLLFLKKELIYYMIIFVSGMIGGGQFATANHSLSDPERERLAGRLYGIDLAGSFLGSFLTVLFLVPLFGMKNTIFFLMFMKALSLIVLLRYKGT